MRHLASTLLLAAAALATSAALAPSADAKPFRPPATGIMAQEPPSFALVRGDGLAADYVQSRSGALVDCAQRGRATFLRMRVSLRWDRTGRLIKITSAGGGAAAVNRCVTRALAGAMPDATGRGTAQIAFTIRKGAPAPQPQPPMPPVKPIKASALDTCKVDSDCTIHYRTSACVPEDPIAVNTLDPVAVRKAYPVKRIECGMGGPQYDELRRQADRWSTTCEQHRCVLVEHPVAPQSPATLPSKF